MTADSTYRKLTTTFDAEGMNYVIEPAFDLRAYLARTLFSTEVGTSAHVDAVVDRIGNVLALVGDVDFPGPHSRVRGPKAEGDPSLSGHCLACVQQFQAGDHTVLLAIGPGRSEEARAAARDNQRFDAVAIEAHVACVTGWDPA